MDSGVISRKGAEKLEAVSSRLHELTKVTEERGGVWVVRDKGGGLETYNGVPP